jgi:hypothetical protein
MKMNDKVYNVLKWTSLVALDAVGVFYKTLSEIWGFGYGNEILATCAAISLFIGALIGISTINYNKNKEKE